MQPTTNLLIAALQSNHVQLLSSGVAPFFVAAQKDIPVTYVFSLQKFGSASALFARNGLKATVKTPKDLAAIKGLRCGSGSPGTTTYASLELFEQFYGFKCQAITNIATTAEGIGSLQAGTGRNRKRVDHVLRVSQLERFAGHYPYQLSGGMRRRLALFQILITEPDLLTLDEPFASLDEPTRLELHALLPSLPAARIAVIVTHDIAEAISLCDVIVVMTNRPGQVKAVHSINIERPRDVYQIRETDSFATLYRTIWAELKDEIAPQEGLTRREKIAPASMLRGLPFSPSYSWAGSTFPNCSREQISSCSNPLSSVRLRPSWAISTKLSSYLTSSSRRSGLRSLRAWQAWCWAS